MGDEAKQIEVQPKAKSSGGFFSAFSAKIMGRSSPPAAAEKTPDKASAQKSLLPNSNNQEKEVPSSSDPQDEAKANGNEDALTAAPNPYAELAAHFAELKSRSELGVDSFEVRDTLGTGTFGRVRLVTYRHRGKAHHLALKMMKKSVVLQLKQVSGYYNTQACTHAPAHIHDILPGLVSIPIVSSQLTLLLSLYLCHRRTRLSTFALSGGS